MMWEPSVNARSSMDRVGLGEGFFPFLKSLASRGVMCRLGYIVVVIC
jgi:hypothetical protein